MARKAKVDTTKLSLDYVWALLRIGIGSIFLWAFVDKLYGLGFSTCRDAETNLVNSMCESAWINGGSPTEGFLKFATKGPLADVYQNLAGSAFVDWMFMLGLLLIGASLILGIGIKIATVTGAALLLMMYAAALPPEHHPLVDDHIIYSIALIGVMLANNSQVLGFGKWWGKQSLVKNYSWLQ